MAAHFRCCRALTLVELLVVVVIMGLLFVLILLAPKPPRENVVTIKCKNQLKQIGLAMIMYADSFQEGYPWADPANWTDSMALLYPDYNVIPQLFRCRSTQDRPEITSTKGISDDGTLYEINKHFGSQAPTWSSYGYDKETSFRHMIATMPIAADMDGTSASNRKSKTANHPGGQNVLLFDGHVDWMTVNTWDNNGVEDNYFVKDLGGGDTDAWIRRP